MNRKEIEQIIPHREPMLLIDELITSEDGKAQGSYTIRGDEWFLQGHYPGNPVVPGVIQCEMAAQTCAALLAGKIAGRTPLYTGIDKVRFRRVVKPGETLRFDCTLTRERDPFYFARGEAYVDGELCMSGEFSFMLSSSNGE